MNGIIRRGIKLIILCIFLLNGVLLELVLGDFLGIGIAVCVGGLFWLAYRRKPIGKLSWIWYALDVLYSAIWGSVSYGGIAILDDIGHGYLVQSVIMRIGTWIAIFLLCLLCLTEFFVYAQEQSRDIKSVFISVFTFNTMFFIIFPISLMVRNMDEYSFPIWIMLGANIVVYLSLVFIETLAFSMITGRLKEIVAKLSAGMVLCIYAQFMFLNYPIGEVAGASYDWRQNVWATLLNILVWSVLLIAPFVVEHFSKNKRIATIYIPLFLLAIQLVALVTEIATGPKEAFEYKLYTFGGEEQYVVSSGENVVMFVFDAMDNMFVKDLIRDDAYDFAAFKDFSMYTNTCSVFDATGRSLPQMLTAGTYDEQPVDYVMAYERMKEAGYTVNFYGYEKDTPQDLIAFVDNFDLISMDEPVNADFFCIFEDSLCLTAYLTVPDIFKILIPINQIEFMKRITFSNKTDYYYANEAYYQNMDLKVNDSSSHYFIMEHLYGVHEPNPGIEETTIYCMDIVKKYIEQLKKLGLYDDATIIITADHGLHDDMYVFPFQTAATPVFFIKMPNQVQEEMKQLETPIYHTDILPTIMYAMGLYGVDGEQQFGKTIFDYQEDEQRVRTFYNRAAPPYSYYEYTFTGNTKDLEDAFERGDYILR